MQLINYYVYNYDQLLLQANIKPPWWRRERFKLIRTAFILLQFNFLCNTVFSPLPDPGHGHWGSRRTYSSHLKFAELAIFKISNPCMSHLQSKFYQSPNHLLSMSKSPPIHVVFISSPSPIHFISISCPSSIHIQYTCSPSPIHVLYIYYASRTHLKCILYPFPIRLLYMSLYLQCLHWRRCSMTSYQFVTCFH